MNRLEREEPTLTDVVSLPTAERAPERNARTHVRDATTKTSLGKARAVRATGMLH
jgi:hypothetical protein